MQAQMMTLLFKPSNNATQGASKLRLAVYAHKPVKLLKDFEAQCTDPNKCHLRILIAKRLISGSFPVV